ncbi:M23 family metallopeptidase [Paenibacillus sp. UMB4589-SE434]|uniref:M23 family metallopeptidase n=1 Tax=Paenibacillus sp. UMB4589-SE434 TaxID=3046314 RepID=UPI00254CF9A3|nr:M23 family metallopeptidase [Paenibacillus sp. UMB4589-SE434]MDK8183279.1 peptidoglycan DD-metalloendopeptidase family protein [Paenibacillus sp. UMB4589-SE434]
MKKQIMKKEWISSKLTIVIMRDAHQSVKQIQLPKLMLAVLPIALSALLLGMAAYLYYQSFTVTSLTAESSQYTNHMQKKEKEIDQLKDQVLQLTALASDVEGRMQQITKMETQLQQFVSTYSNPKELTKTKSSSKKTAALIQPVSLSARSLNAINPMGGEYREASSEEMIALAKSTGDKLRKMPNTFTSLLSNVNGTLQEVKETEHILHGTPTLWPTESTRITSLFGYREDPFNSKAALHSGLDIGGSHGDTVYAAAEGRVADTGLSESRGNYIIIRHPESGLTTRYYHLSSVKVESGAKVAKGDPIGGMGSTGRSTGTHLHFEVVENDSPVDPLPYLQQFAEVTIPTSLQNNHE